MSTEYATNPVVEVRLDRRGNRTETFYVSRYAYESSTRDEFWSSPDAPQWWADCQPDSHSPWDCKADSCSECVDVYDAWVRHDLESYKVTEVPDRSTWRNA